MPPFPMSRNRQPLQLDVENDKVKVVVSMFGRETPVELELDQVQLDD